MRVEVRSSRAFTIIEVLVVVGIIALLIGLLMPALSAFRKGGYEAASASNLRQWGIGTINFTTLHKEMLPWEGKKDLADMPENFAAPDWWANAVPPLVGQPPYREISTQATANDGTVPLPPDDRSIFIDPGAYTPPDAPYIGGNNSQFFFCYVPNLQLNNTWQFEGTNDPHARIRMTQISRSDATVLMAEIRTRAQELPPHDPFYGFGLARARTDWKRCAARHRDGCNLLFADGHVNHFPFQYFTTNSLGTRNPEEPGADWNKKDIIWNPLGPALED